MDKEKVKKILEKIKETVGENNYKLALAITGHRTGKIKDIIICSKDGELLLEYIENLEQQVQKQKEVIDKANKYLHTRGIQQWSNGTHYRGLDGLQVQVLEDILKEVSE